MGDRDLQKYRSPEAMHALKCSLRTYMQHTWPSQQVGLALTQSSDIPAHMAYEPNPELKPQFTSLAPTRT